MSRIFARLAAVTAGLIAPAVLATAALAGTCPSQSNGPDFGPAVSDWHPGLHSPYTNGTIGHGTFTFGHGTFGSGQEAAEAAAAQAAAAALALIAGRRALT